MTKENLGKFILENRKSLGMTQEELANKVFVTNKAVSKWEKVQSFPDIALFEPIAEALGVTVSELIAGEKEAKAEATIKSLLAEIFKKERIKKYLIFSLAAIFVAAFCLGGYIGKEIELDNFDYIYIGGFYYQFEIGNEYELVDERFLTECIGEVMTTGVRRNEIRNQNGDSNVYPVGAKIYKLDTGDEEYQEEFKGRICFGEAAIGIDGKYYRGYIVFTGVRDYEIYRSFYRKIYNI